MNRPKNRRVLMLSLAMAAVLSLPLAASAQGGRASHGGLFGSKASATNNAFLDASGNRGSSSLSAGNQAFGAADAGGLTNEPFGIVPVGSGIMILLGAGIGYATLKHRKND